MREQSRWRTARPGVTLPELMVGLIIMAVLTSLAFPTVARNAATRKLEAAAYLISSDLERAFSLASRQRRPVTVTVDATTRRFMIRDRTTSALLLDRHMSGKDSPYALTGLSMNVASVTVFPNGHTSQPAVIRLGIADQARHVSLTRTGLVRIVVP